MEDHVTEAVTAVNKDLLSIESWSKSNGLGVNPAKTKVIAIASSWMSARIDYSSLHKILFGGIPLPMEPR